MSSSPSPSSIAARWREVRHLYPVYAALAKKFGLASPPYSNVEKLSEGSETEVIAKVQAWLAELDARIEPHQFRQILQGSDVVDSEQKLQALVRRHLGKPGRSETDRDKLNFLLTEYFVVSAPPSFHARDATFEDVAAVLEPVIGECSVVPQSLQAVLELISEAGRCQSLEELNASDVLRGGRELKAAAGETYFGATALTVFTFFNYSLRKVFAPLFEKELLAIDAGLSQLEAGGVRQVDCTAAGLSAEEPTAALRSWVAAARDTVVGEYALDASARQAQLLRQAVETALAPPSGLSKSDLRRILVLETAVQQLNSDQKRIREELQKVRKLIGAAMAEKQRPAASSNVTAAAAVLSSNTGTPPADQKGVKPALPSVSVPSSSPSSALLEQEFSKELQEYRERLSRAVAGVSSKAETQIRLEQTTLPLTAGEIEAFQAGSDEAAALIRSAAAARTLIIERVEQAKTSPNIDVAPALKLGRSVLAQLQRMGGKQGARSETLVSAGKLLWAALQHAEAAYRRAHPASDENGRAG